MDLIPTSRGRVGLTAPRDGDPARPLVLVIRGLTAVRQLADLAVPGADVAFIDLPGHIAPTFSDYSVQTMAAAFDEAVSAALPARPMILVGVSLGAAVAMAMRPADLAERVLIEPFLRTAHLEPLLAWSQAATGELARVFRDALGYGCGGTAYRIPKGPLTVIVGRQPGSLCDEADRAALTTAGARLIYAESGHNVPRDDPETIRAALATLVAPYSRKIGAERAVHG